MIPLNFGGKNQHDVTPLTTEENQEVSQFFGQSSFATISRCLGVKVKRNSCISSLRTISQDSICLQLILNHRTNLTNISMSTFTVKRDMDSSH
jgi:hypothetical protein